MRQTAMYRHLAAGAAALTLIACFSGGARADEAYGFAIQGIQGLRIATSGGGSIHAAGAQVAVSGTSNASVGGVSVTQTGTVDALQAFVGPGLTAPGENFGLRAFPPALSAGGTTGLDGDAFANFAAGSPLAAGSLPNGVKNAPGSPPSSYARGDMLITGTLSDLFTGVGINAYNVAEAYLNGLPMSATASGGYTITAVFTATGTGSLDIIGTAFSNSVFAAVNPEIFNGVTTATASYKTDYTLNNLSTPGPSDGRQPAPLNHTQSAAFNIGETLASGSDLASFSIVAGQRYQLQISIEESTAVTAGVPEPGPVVLAALGGLMVAAGGLRRRLARREQPEASI